MNRPPLDLRNLPLRSAVGGYARADVEAFFERVAPDYERARARLDELRVEHGRVMAQLAEAQEHERKVARVLSAAELASGQILARGRDAAAEQIATAERAGEDLLRAAEAERARILAEIERIRYRHQRLIRVLEAEIAGLLIPDAEPRIDAVSVETPPEPVRNERHPDAPVDAAPAVATAVPAGGDVTPATVEPIRGVVEEAPAVVHLAPAEVETVPVVLPTLETVATASMEGLTTATSLGSSNIANTPGVAAYAGDAGAAGAGFGERKAHTAEGAAPWLATGADESRPGDGGPVAEEQTPPQVASADQLTTSVPARRSRRGMLVAAGVAAVVIISVAAIPWMGRTSAASARHDSPAKTAAPVVRTAAQSPAPATPTTPPATPAAVSVPAPSPDALTVQLKATSDCWVRLTAGSYSEERLLAAGETLQHESTSDVVVRTGNAGALIVTVNGRAMAPLGGEGQVVTRRITRPIPVG